MGFHPQLDRLGQLIDGGDAAHDQPVAEPLDTLMVVRLGGVHELAGGPRGERALGQQDVVLGSVERARDAPVLVMTVALRQVLHERAAAGDVDQLHATTDAEHRQLSLDRSACQCHLEGVALRHGPARLGMRLPAVAARIDVGAAGEDQAVDQLEHLVGVARQLGVGREHRDEPTGALHGVDVVARQQRRLLVPHAPTGALDRGADADHGPFHAPHHRINAHTMAAVRPIESSRGDR